MLSLLLSSVAKLQLMHRVKRADRNPVIMCLMLAGWKCWSLSSMHLCESRARTTSVQAEGWLTLHLLSVPIRSVLENCGGGLAKRRLVAIVVSGMILFLCSVGRWWFLLLLLLAPRLWFLLQMVRKFGLIMAALAVWKARLALVVRLTDSALSSVGVTR